MSNYIAALSLIACAAVAADKPAPRPAAAPVASAARYTQAAGSALTFSFVQVGASNTGRFGQFQTELLYDEKNLAASSLKVSIQMASVATQDDERDATLKDTDLFDVQKFPTASYSAPSLARTAGGKLEAVGKLTLRGVTHDLRLPLNIRATSSGLELSGEALIRRLDYGVGQGDWKSTESVGDEVKVQYKVLLTRAK